MGMLECLLNDLTELNSTTTALFRKNEEEKESKELSVALYKYMHPVATLTCQAHFQAA